MITKVEAEILLELVHDVKEDFDECYPLSEIEKKLKNIMIETPLMIVHKIVMNEFSKLSDKQLNELATTDYIRDMIMLQSD